MVLAKLFGYRFLDSDLLIQEQTGRLLRTIIAEDGLEAFKKIENDVNASLDVHRTVIATGGSVIYGQEAMEHLKSIGTVVYIRLPFTVIRRRLGNLRNRGVAMQQGQTLQELFDERTPLYEQYADLIVNEKHSSIAESAEFIWQKLQFYAKNGGDAS